LERVRRRSRTLLSRSLGPRVGRAVPRHWRVRLCTIGRAQRGKGGKEKGPWLTRLSARPTNSSLPQVQPLAQFELLKGRKRKKKCALRLRAILAELALPAENPDRIRATLIRERKKRKEKTAPLNSTPEEEKGEKAR